MAKRRANGEGNLRKRKDGRWEGKWALISTGPAASSDAAIQKKV